MLKKRKRKKIKIKIKINKLIIINKDQILQNVQ